MTSRTSCCKSAFFKDITRFAPAWGLYILCLFLGLLLMAMDELGTTLPNTLAACISLMPLVNCGYGFLTATLLFGDLHNSRLCFGIHTLPLRREQWFYVHIGSGLLFSLVPTALMALAALPMCMALGIEGIWQIPLLWWAASNLQYVFFFGVAVLSMMLTGSRLGAALVYGVIQLAAVGVWILVNTLYIPLLYGFVQGDERFFWFSPLVKMMSWEYLDMDITRVYHGLDKYTYEGSFTLLSHWWYVGLCAILGVLLGQLGLECYRRRDLETAGNTVAFLWLKPFFQVAAVLAATVAAQFFLEAFLGIDLEHEPAQNLLVLAAAAAVGWFAGLMILSHTTRVFTGRSFLALGALVAVFFGSIGLTMLDPLGLETRIPEADQVASAELYINGDRVILTEPEDIENARFFHHCALQSRYGANALRYQGVEYEEHSDLPEAVDYSQVEYPMSYQLSYTLKNGRTLVRQFRFYPNDPDGQLMETYLTTLECVTGSKSAAELYRKLESVELESKAVNATAPELWELMQAIEADCQAGTMAQYSGYHREVLYEDPNSGAKYEAYWLRLYVQEYELPAKKYEKAVVYTNTISLHIYADCENTLAWIEKMGLTDWLRRY